MSIEVSKSTPGNYAICCYDGADCQNTIEYVYMYYIYIIYIYIICILYYIYIYILYVYIYIICILYYIYIYIMYIILYVYYIIYILYTYIPESSRCSVRNHVRGASTEVQPVLSTISLRPDVQEPSPRRGSLHRWTWWFQRVISGWFSDLVVFSCNSMGSNRI